MIVRDAVAAVLVWGFSWESVQEGSQSSDSGQHHVVQDGETVLLGVPAMKQMEKVPSFSRGWIQSNWCWDFWLNETVYTTQERGQPTDGWRTMYTPDNKHDEIKSYSWLLCLRFLRKPPSGKSSAHFRLFGMKTSFKWCVSLSIWVLFKSFWKRRNKNTFQCRPAPQRPYRIHKPHGIALSKLENLEDTEGAGPDSV